MHPTAPSPAPARPAARPRLSAVLCALVTVLAVHLTAAADLPAGWFKDGKAPRLFRAGVDTEVSRNGGTSAYLRSWTASPPVFGTLMQQVDAERYRGKRLRLTGWLKTEEVDHEDGWAGLWMRVESPAGRSISYDNTEEEPVRETSEDWVQCTIVLDVADDAEVIAFGFMLVGAGRVWADDIAFEEVGPEVPVTATPHRRGLPKEPVNLGFDG